MAQMTVSQFASELKMPAPALLEQLAKKPGIHAVHLSKCSKANIVPGDARLG